MHIKFQIRWAIAPGSGEIEPALFLLLQLIRREGALTQAARLAGYSYRHAWGLIKRWEEEFGLPLVKLERGRGRGAELTAFGERLLWVNQRLNEETGPRLETLAGELNESLAEFSRSGRPLHLSLYASHGLAIEQLNELLNAEPELETDFQVHGSLESLHMLNIGQCQMAGFHFPLGELGKKLVPRYLRWIDERRHNLLLVATRRQGIMAQAGNPKRIRDIHDLTRRSVRYINRQKGSGTRTIFDQLLQDAGIRSSRIAGYANEEFTHFAVAAMVASGAADAGFGLQAAAARFNLHFIPVLKERYMLALDKDLGPGLQQKLVRLLRSRRFKQSMGGYEGYDVKQAGREIRAGDLCS
jgi:putative molybdopterin biosynthesis protein